MIHAALAIGQMGTPASRRQAFCCAPARLPKEELGPRPVMVSGWKPLPLAWLSSALLISGSLLAGEPSPAAAISVLEPADVPAQLGAVDLQQPTIVLTRTSPRLSLCNSFGQTDVVSIPGPGSYRDAMVLLRNGRGAVGFTQYAFPSGSLASQAWQRLRQAAPRCQGRFTDQRWQGTATLSSGEANVRRPGSQIVIPVVWVEHRDRLAPSHPGDSSSRITGFTVFLQRGRSLLATRATLSDATGFSPSQRQAVVDLALRLAARTPETPTEHSRQNWPTARPHSGQDNPPPGS